MIKVRLEDVLFALEQENRGSMTGFLEKIAKNRVFRHFRNFKFCDPLSTLTPNNFSPELCWALKLYERDSTRIVDEIKPFAIESVTIQSHGSRLREENGAKLRALGENFRTPWRAQK